MQWPFNLGDEALTKLQGEAKCRLGKLYTAKKNDARQALEEKIAEDLDSGDSWLHHMPNGPNASNIMQAVIAHDGTPSIDHNDILEVCSKHWAEQWQCNSDMQPTEAIKLAIARASTATSTTKHITTQHILLATKGFKHKTSVGGDDWLFTDIACLPEPILNALADMFNNCKNNCKNNAVPPWQAMLNLLSMLSKALRHRTVAILSTFYRLLVAAGDDDIEQDDKLNAFEHDSAQPGASTIESSEHRALQAELAIAEN